MSVRHVLARRAAPALTAVALAATPFMPGTAPAVSPESSLQAAPSSSALGADTRREQRGRHPVPMVFGHRGASGYVPEHTLTAYRTAIDMGADFIEPDLVSTRDGELVARHENNITETTDVAEHPEFADRRKTMTVEGVRETGWFTEDFTLAELKTLRAVERLPEVRPDNTAYDGLYEVATLDEVVELAQDRGVGVLPELKSPTHFREIGLPMERTLVSTLHRAGYDDPRDPAFIQSFEPTSMQRVNRMTDLPVVQNVDNREDRPYGFEKRGDPRTYGDLLTPEGLEFVDSYADAIGTNKDLLVPRDAQDRLLESTRLLRHAHREGLEVYAYTFRNENEFLPAGLRRGDPDSPVFAQATGDAAAEYRLFYELGVDGVWSDNPDTAVAVRDELFERPNEDPTRPRS